MSYFVSVFLKDKEYQKEYFKKVIEKRLAAYQLLETVVNELQYSTANSADKRLYHVVFHTKEQYDVFHSLLFNAVKSNLWLSHNASSQLSTLNQQIYNATLTSDFSVADERHQAAKANFEIITKMRDRLRHLIRHDMYHMHDVERFFKNGN
ncbi:hypothetical protein AM218_11285 [Hymenobacter sp. DG25A]|nr:hypothetical protein AM218_11285 [Hymenobacter sp. DG25A]